MAFITATSTIRERTIYLNHTLIYENDSVGLDDFLEDVYKHIEGNYPKFYKMDRLSKLGFLAAELLMKNISLNEYAPESIAVVLSNEYASLDTDIRFMESTRSAASPALFVYTLPNIVAGELCIRHGIKGENSFFVTQGFNAELMATYVNQILMSNAVQACLAGWIDVMGEHHDVFLYLVEKQNRGLGLEHSEEQLLKIYQ